MRPFLSRTTAPYFGFLAILIACYLAACSYDSALTDITCESDGECPKGATCDDGYCVGGQSPAADAGDDADTAELDTDTGEPDTDTEVPDADVECIPESDEEFCQRYGVECGTLEAENECGELQEINCEEISDDFGCLPLEECKAQELVDDAEHHYCECSVDDSEQVCDSELYECGEVEPKAFCSGWDDEESVDCGGCPGNEECGTAAPNICGCPCEVDGVCYAAGASAEDNDCMVCDPAQSEDSLVPADAGTTCTTTVPGAQGFCSDDGVCEPDCGAGSLCEMGGQTYCADLENDDTNCGQCGHACGANEYCTGSVCECTVEKCEGQCQPVEFFENDNNHCGQCDNHCDSDDCFECSDNQCVFACDDGDVCDGDGSCVECTNNDHCDSDDCLECSGNQCVSTCDDDEFCDGSGNCVECTNNDHCDSDDCLECSGNQCVFACDDGDVCDGDGSCVECTNNDHCDSDDCLECSGNQCLSRCDAHESCIDGSCECDTDLDNVECCEDSDCTGSAHSCQDDNTCSPN